MTTRPYDHATTRPRDHLALLLTLTAFLLRLWRLDVQSLRGDEAFDVLFASQPLAEIINQLRINQIYPPLFHTLDHFWLLLAGTSQFSARFLAFAAGVLLLPVAYRFARELFDERTARVSAMLAAVHPFLIWHAQDGRMYELLGLFVLLSAWCAVRIWKQADLGRISPRAFVAYAIVALLAIMTHYFAYVAIFAVNVAALVLSRQRRWSLSIYVRWFAANAVVGVFGVSWIALAWARFSTHTADWITASSPLDVLQRSFVAYSLGTTVDWNLAWPLLVVLAGLLCLGVWNDRQTRKAATRANQLPANPASVMLLIIVLLPLLFIYLGSLWRPMYDEKFLIFIVPFYVLLLARGIVALGGVQWFATAAIVLGMGVSLFNYQFDPRFAKSPPWREAAQTILANAQPGDVVVYNFPDPSLPYQIGAVLPVVLLPAQGQYEAGATPLDASSVERDLTALSDQDMRIWFFPQPAANWDKDGAVGRWLGRYTDRDWAATVGSLNVERYLTPRAYQARWTPLAVQFDDHIKLTAYRVPKTSDGDSKVELVLYWQATAIPSKDYTVFAHILNEAGALVAQQDNPPVNGTYSTSQWAVGKVIVDRYDIMIENSLAPGRYRFEIGLYDAAGTRLHAGAEDKVVLGAISR